MQNNIHNTVIVPYIIAEKVTDNVKNQDILIEKSERIYASNETWRNQFNKAPDQREFLKMFMQHWNLSLKN